MYWESRKHLKYYKKVLKLAKKYSFDAKSVLDVGSHDTPLLDYIDWISKKVAIDLNTTPTNKTSLNLKIDFLKYDRNDFDFVLCLQVLEHIINPEKFASKLLNTGNIIIISVPYKWDKDFCDHHIHDPIDEGKIKQWFKKDWIDHTIVEEFDGTKRLIVVFKGIAH